MSEGKIGSRTFKIKIRQEYEVEIYYQEGILCENSDEALEIAFEDCIELAFEEEGVVVRLHEQTETSNGYIANVTTLEPETELVYTVPNISVKLANELKKKGIEICQKK